jgi:hypothetical protein
VITAGLLNLPWMQLRRITTSILIVVIGLWRGEIPHEDAQLAVRNTLELLNILGTRWKTASSVAGIVRQLADKSGEEAHQIPLGLSFTWSRRSFLDLLCDVVLPQVAPVPSDPLVGSKPFDL